MEQQAHPASDVGVESEGIGPRHELGDVAREDHDEEGGDEPADLDPPAGERQEHTGEADLEDTGDEDDGVGVDREPRRRLGEELPCGLRSGG